MAEEWVSITDAARRLSAAGDTIDRSSLSRYLKQHAEALPTKREGRSNLVEFEALAAHRGENIRVHSAAPAKGAPDRQADGRRQVDGAARKAMADAEMRELDLAARRGELTVAAEVDRAGREAIALMRTAFERAIETEAQSYSVKYGWDERATRVALKSFSKIGLDAFHHEMLQRLDKARGQQAAGEAGDTDMSAVVEYPRLQ